MIGNKLRRNISTQSLNRNINDCYNYALYHQLSRSNLSFELYRSRALREHVYITAIIPAYNEANDIAKAIDSIRFHVDKIIVACDNCTDDTAKVAKRANADVVFNTYDNHHRKAGALNQALEKYVNWDIRNQYLLVMDADTIVVNPNLWFYKAESLIYPNRPRLGNRAQNMSNVKRHYLKLFHHSLYNKLFKDRAYDCVGSIFQASKNSKHDSLLTEGQRLEWQYYANKVERTRKVFVLTGTCSLLSARMLLKVYHMHNDEYFYDDKSLTEDFFMTLSLKKCHARLISPVACMCRTAVKSTTKSLMRQRRRWYTGALQTLKRLGINRITLPYYGQQVLLFISTFAFLLFLLVSIYLYATCNTRLTWFWSLIFVGYDIDQAAKGWKYGNWLDRLYSITLVGCLCYSFILQMAYIWSLYTFITRKSIYWNNRTQ